jgi:hypothetical protein
LEDLSARVRGFRIILLLSVCLNRTQPGIINCYPCHALRKPHRVIFDLEMRIGMEIMSIRMPNRIKYGKAKSQHGIRSTVFCEFPRSKGACEVSHSSLPKLSREGRCQEWTCLLLCVLHTLCGAGHSSCQNWAAFLQCSFASSSGDCSTVLDRGGDAASSIPVGMRT